MAVRTSRSKRTRCSNDNGSQSRIQMLILVRNIDGSWHTAHRLCWDCGYDLLKRLQPRPAGKPA